MPFKLQASPVTRSFTPLIALTALALSGCSQVYDDTKGWGNDVEAWFRKDVLAPIGAEIRGEPYPPRTETPALVEQPASPATQVVAMPKPESEAMAKDSAPADTMAKGAVVASTDASLPVAAATPADAPRAAMPAKPEAGGLGTNIYPQTAGKAPDAAQMKKPEAAPETAPKAAAKKAEPASKPKAAGAAMALHLSSNKTKDSAMREWAQLKTAFPKLLGELEPEIARTDLGKKGVFYRVLAGSFQDKPAAAQICSQLKKKQQYCMVLRSPKSGS